MLWTFLAVSAIAAALIQLGALSVWVAVLSLVLKALLALISVAALFFMWRRFNAK